MPASTSGRPAAVLSILVTANTRQAAASMAAINRQAAYSARKVGASSVSMANSLNRMTVAAKFAGVGVAAGLAGSVAAAISFQNEFANVKKTVAGAPEDFKKVKDGIIEMSKHIPESANSLANLAAEAGALGVPLENLEKFTKTAAKLGSATQMTSEMAATTLARLGKIMGENTTGDFQRMGSVLVDLGNKGASTEDEIGAMALRIAAAGNQVGLSAAQVEGLSASLANIGIRAEMGGSAASRILLAMDAAIADNGKELEQWATVAGMTGEEFAKTFGTDPTLALDEFTQGLARMKDSGESVAPVLTDLGKIAHTSMNEIRVRQTLLGLAGATDEVARTQRIANHEWRQNVALNTEFEKKARTLENQLEMLKNEIVAVGIGIGDDLMPHIRILVDALRDPKLTLGEKVEAVIHELTEVFKDAVPIMANIGGQLGLALIGGIWEAFKSANILGKLFTLGVFIRLIGGPGAIRAAGVWVATTLGSAIMGSHAIQSALQYAIGRSIAWQQRGAIGAQGFATAAGGMPWATRIADGLAKALPVAIAAAGVANILQDALGGDMEGAAWELGGGIAGAIAGGIIGGLPGALIGGGLGTVLGDLLGDLAGDMKGQKLDDFISMGDSVDRLRKDAKQSRHVVTELVKDAEQSHDHLNNLKERDRKQSNKVKKAEENLLQVRRKYGPKSEEAIVAEHKLNTQKRKGVRLSNELQRADQLEGAERRHRIDVLQREIRPQKAAVAAAKEEEEQLKQTFLTLEEEQRHLSKGTDQFREHRKQVDDAYDAWRDGAKASKDATHDVNKTLADAQKLIGPKFAKRLDKMGDRMGTIRGGVSRLSDVLTNQFNARIERLSDASGSIIPSGQKDPGKRLAFLHDRLEDVDDIARRRLFNGLDTLKEKTASVGDKSKDTGEKAGEAFEDLDWAVQLALTNVGVNVNNVLERLGLQSKDFGVSKPSKGKGKPKKAAGGEAIVPGHTAGDQVHVGALVEPGEGLFVMNRNAMGPFQKFNDMFPRRAAGGSVTGDLSGLNPQFLNALRGMAGAGGPINVNSGFRSRGEQAQLYASYLAGTGNLAAAPGSSHHETGIAADINPGREHFGGMAGRFGLGFTVPSESWHIELLNAAAAGKFGAAAQKIARVLITGPPGVMRDGIGQGSVDLVIKAANRYIAKHAPQTTGMSASTMTGSGDVQKMFAKVAKAKSRHRSATMALGEAGYAESGMRDLAGGDASSQGALQLLASTANALGVSPHDEAAIASLFFDVGFTGRGGANKLAASGMAPHMIAQGVQGSAFGSGSNYAAQAGPAQSWMRRFNLMRGGTPPWGGSFRESGRVPGPKGERRRVVAHGGEWIGNRPIELHLHGRGAREAFATMDDVYAIVDGERVEVEGFEKRRARRRKKR